MVDVMKLKGKIVEKGYNTEKVADAIGINRATFYRRLKEKGNTFTIKEANMIRELLGLTTEEAITIFFKNDVA